MDMLIKSFDMGRIRIKSLFCSINCILSAVFLHEICWGIWPQASRHKAAACADTGNLTPLSPAAFIYRLCISHKKGAIYCCLKESETAKYIALIANSLYRIFSNPSRIAPARHYPAPPKTVTLQVGYNGVQTVTFPQQPPVFFQWFLLQTFSGQRPQYRSDPALFLLRSQPRSEPSRKDGEHSPLIPP